MALEVDPLAEIYSESGHSVPALELETKHVLDKTIGVFGASNSGKTVIIKTCMEKIAKHVDIVIAVVPTATQNKAYDGMIQPVVIHPRLYLPDPTGKKKADTPKKGGERFLTAVWNLMEMKMAVWRRANAQATLQRLYMRLPVQERKEGVKPLLILDERRKALLEELKRKHTEQSDEYKQKKIEINERFMDLWLCVVKKAITPRIKWLLTLSLTEDEKYAIEYIHFNPRLLFILDDAAAELKPLFNTEIFRKFFYQGRHLRITTLISCQDDTDMPTNLRKNMALSFYSTEVVADANFSRPSNKYPQEQKDLVKGVKGQVYSVRRRMLAYIRDDPTGQFFYHYKAPYVPKFEFGSRAMNELCVAVTVRGSVIDRENPYYDSFRVS
jgi:ABC-type dipeptide/oligopeptide/nickel transport system ATPase component